MDILDPVTLQRLQTLKSPQNAHAPHKALIFSPDSRVLTYSSGGGSEQSLISWDLQTGGVISVIRPRAPSGHTAKKSSIVYSMDGKMIGVVYWGCNTTIILTYDVVSGVRIHSHLLGRPFSASGPLSGDIPFLNDIWTHGESIRFATIRPAAAAIIIWDVRFASGTTPTEIETFSIPDDVRSVLHADRIGNFTDLARLLSTKCRLALAHKGGVLVWDTRNPKSLLSHTEIKCNAKMSFSSDGRFFACSTDEPEIYLWKESPTGYTLHGTVVSSAGGSTPFLSPDGESIVAFELQDRTIQPWHTKNFTTPSSTLSTRAPQYTTNFILDFSPDGALAVVAGWGDNVVTVLDLKSSVPQLIIDTTMGVYGLRVTRNTVVILGEGMMVTWNLPVGDCVPNARASTKDSTRTTNLSSWPEGDVIAASISPDVQHVAFTTFGLLLYIYSASTGECLGHSSTGGIVPWFTPDGRGVWCAAGSGIAELWTITENGPRRMFEVPAVDLEYPPEGYPWRSSRGYQTTSDGWVLGPDGKRLLMLPPPWQSYPVQRVWNGRFLALLDGILSEPVILELDS